ERFFRRAAKRGLLALVVICVVGNVSPSIQLAVADVRLAATATRFVKALLTLGADEIRARAAQAQVASPRLATLFAHAFAPAATRIAKAHLVGKTAGAHGAELATLGRVVALGRRNAALGGAADGLGQVGLVRRGLVRATATARIIEGGVALATLDVFT